MDKVDQFLNALAKSLGIAADRLMDWFTVKAIAEGKTDLATAVVLIIVAIVASYWFKKVSTEEVVDDDVDSFLAVVSSVAAIGGFVVGFIFLRFAIIELSAPQAYAVEQIIKAIKQ